MADVLNALRPPRPLVFVTSTKALAGVAEEAVLADAADEHIGKAVVVEVADGDSHPIHLDVETRDPCDVGEGPVAVVAIQAQRGALPAMTRPVGTVHEQDVLPAVVVVVEKRAAEPSVSGSSLPP